MGTLLSSTISHEKFSWYIALLSISVDCLGPWSSWLFEYPENTPMWLAWMRGFLWLLLGCCCLIYPFPEGLRCKTAWSNHVTERGNTNTVTGANTALHERPPMSHYSPMSHCFSVASNPKKRGEVTLGVILCEEAGHQQEKGHNNSRDSGVGIKFVSFLSWRECSGMATRGKNNR